MGTSSATSFSNLNLYLSELVKLEECIIQIMISQPTTTLHLPIFLSPSVESKSIS